MAIFIYIIVAYISIFIHELGHYLTAYLFGVRATDVVTGMGYRLFTFKTKYTLFTFKCLPGGGMTTYAEGDLKHLTPLQSILMLASGVLLNYFTAIVAMTLYLKTNLVNGFHALNEIAIDFVFNLFKLLRVKDLFFPETTLTESVEKISTHNSLLTFVIFLFIFMNLVLFLFNLLPIPFFDGGQIIGILVDPFLLRLGITEIKLKQFKSFVNQLIGTLLMIIVTMPFLSHVYYRIIHAVNPLKQLILYVLLLLCFILIKRLFFKKRLN